MGCKEKGIRKLEFVATTQFDSLFFAKKMKAKFPEICLRIFRERTKCEKYETFVKEIYLGEICEIFAKTMVFA